MKRPIGNGLQLLICLASCLQLSACQTSPPRPQQIPPLLARAPQIAYGGGDGATQDTAIRIQGAPNDFASTRAEYAWLGEHFPGFKRKNQALVPASRGKFFDVIDIELSNGEMRTFYFDISETFGKR